MRDLYSHDIEGAAGFDQYHGCGGEDSIELRDILDDPEESEDEQ